MPAILETTVSATVVLPCGAVYCSHGWLCVTRTGHHAHLTHLPHTVKKARGGESIPTLQGLSRVPHRRITASV